MDYPLVENVDRVWLRDAWLAVQGRCCAVCGVHAEKRIKPRTWLLDYQSGHGKPYCWDCIAGAVCRACLFALSKYRMHTGNIPRKPVNGLDPYEWAARAAYHVNLGECRASGKDETDGTEAGP